MEYRQLTADHIPEVADFFVQAFSAPPWSEQWTIETASKRLQAMMSHSGAYGLIAYQCAQAVGAILGYEEAYYNGPRFEIKEFWTSQACQGQGIGSELLVQLEQRLQQRGICQVVLLTARGERTEGFYQHRGYRLCEDQIWMLKQLETC